MQVSIACERHYPHAPDVMWRVFAHPDISSTLDHRVALVSSVGAPGSVGSSYELAIKVGARKAQQHVEVVDSSEPSRLRATTFMKGKAVADQLAELTSDQGGTRVTWTVTQKVPAALAFLVRRQVRRELPRWLDAAGSAAKSAGL